MHSNILKTNAQVGVGFADVFQMPAVCRARRSNRLNSKEDLKGYSNEVLKESLVQNGFIYLPQFLNRDSVLQARACVLREMHNAGALLVNDQYSLDDAVPLPGSTVSLLNDLRYVASEPAVASVLECDDLFQLFRILLDEQHIGTLPFKWLRAVGQQKFTGVHIDRVFVGQATGKILTAWIPLGDIPVEMGSLAVCQHSHKRDSALFDLLHATYGQTFVGQNGTSDGWLTDDGSLVKQSIEQWQTDKTPKMDQETSIQWLTTNFKAGDVLVLDIDTLHMTLANTMNDGRLRISCDTRWQPLSEPSIIPLTYPTQRNE